MKRIAIAALMTLLAGRATLVSAGGWPLNRFQILVDVNQMTASEAAQSAALAADGIWAITENSPDISAGAWPAVLAALNANRWAVSEDNPNQSYEVNAVSGDIGRPVNAAMCYEETSTEQDPTCDTVLNSAQLAAAVASHGPKVVVLSRSYNPADPRYGCVNADMPASGVTGLAFETNPSGSSSSVLWTQNFNTGLNLCLSQGKTCYMLLPPNSSSVSTNYVGDILGAMNYIAQSGQLLNPNLYIVLAAYVRDGTNVGFLTGDGGSGALLPNGTNSNSILGAVAALYKYRNAVAPQATLGVLDAVEPTSLMAAGWALDPETSAGSAQAISVNLYVDGPVGSGALAGAVLANKTRADVNAATGFMGNHGFQIPIPTRYQDGKSHKWYAYGISASGSAPLNSLLTGSPMTVTIPLPPAPIVNSALSAANAGGAGTAALALTIVWPSSGTVSASGLTLAMPQTFSQVLSLNVSVPPGAFPTGAPLSVAANSGALPAAATNEASEITPFGANVGLVLTANGLQPTAPVTITMAYDSTQIPAGQSESRLKFWRYDPASLQWTLVPSYDDPVGHVLTAQTPHLSTFAPFFVAAGTDVNAVQVFPQPWETGDPASPYWSSVLTFSGLPPGANMKIFTIMGELVWSGTTEASGVLTWDGNTRFGSKAASGTYYITFQSAGQTKTRRMVIVR